MEIRETMQMSKSQNKNFNIDPKNLDTRKNKLSTCFFSRLSTANFKILVGYRLQLNNLMQV